MLPIEESELEIWINDKDEHPKKQPFPISMTELGIWRFLRFVQFLKQKSEKRVIFAGISNDKIALFRMVSLPFIIRNVLGIKKTMNNNILKWK
jgi:hypothetical protein